MKEVDSYDQKKGSKKKNNTATFAPIGTHINEAKQKPKDEISDLSWTYDLFDTLKKYNKEDSLIYQISDKKEKEIRKLMKEREEDEKEIIINEEPDEEIEENKGGIIIDDKSFGDDLSGEEMFGNPQGFTEPGKAEPGKKATDLKSPVVSDSPNFAYVYKPWQEEPIFGAAKDEYKVNTMSRMDLKKNSDQISRLYNILDSKDHWYKGSSDNFRDLMSDLKDLKKMSQELVKLRADHKTITDPQKLTEKTRKERELFQRYSDLSKLVEQRANTYLEGKKYNVNSPYAKARFQAVTELKDILPANRESIEKAFADEAGKRTARISGRRQDARSLQTETKNLADWYKDKYQKYSLNPGNAANRKSFMGDNFSEEDLANANTVFSVKRTAAHSVAIMAMLCEKGQIGGDRYSINSILDPSKLQKEKQEMFKKVMEKMTSGKEEDKDWIAEKMVQGTEIANKKLNELLAPVNYKKSDYIYSENFTKASMLSGAMFDVWQEMDRMKDTVVKAVNKPAEKINDEKILKKVTYDEYHQRIGNERGYLDQFGVNMQRYAEAVSGLSKPEMFEIYGPQVMTFAYTVNVLRDDFAKKALESSGKPYEKWFDFTEGGIGRGTMLAALDNFRSVDISPEMLKENLPSIMNGNAFSNISRRYDPNADRKVILDGTLDLKMMEQDKEFSKLSDDEVIRRIDNQIEYFDRMKKTSTPEVQQYIGSAIKGMSYLSRFTFSPRDMKPDEKKNAGKCIRDIFSCHLAAELSKTGLTGEALKKEVNKVVETLPEYKRYMDGLGKHALAGILMTDVSGSIVDCNEVMISKGRIYEQKIANKACKNVREFNEAYAHAYAAAMYKENGKLPLRPDKAGVRFDIKGYADHLIQNNLLVGGNKASARNHMENPRPLINLLHNKNALGEELVRLDAETTRKRQEQFANDNVNNKSSDKNTKKTVVKNK